MEEIIAKVQALQTADAAALADIVAALQAVPASSTPDEVVSITLTKQSGATTVFVPQS